MLGYQGNNVQRKVNKKRVMKKVEVKMMKSRKELFKCKVNFFL